MIFLRLLGYRQHFVLHQKYTKDHNASSSHIDPRRNTRIARHPLLTALRIRLVRVLEIPPLPPWRERSSQFIISPSLSRHSRTVASRAHFADGVEPHRWHSRWHRKVRPLGQFWETHRDVRIRCHVGRWRGHRGRSPSLSTPPPPISLCPVAPRADFRRRGVGGPSRLLPSLLPRRILPRQAVARPRHGHGGLARGRGRRGRARRSDEGDPPRPRCRRPRRGGRGAHTGVGLCRL